MSETEINDLLIQGRKAADYQLSIGNEKTANEILGLTSRYCDFLLKTYELNGKVVCSQCKRNFTNAIERDYIREVGVCYGCDSLIAEAMAEREDDLDNLVN